MLVPLSLLRQQVTIEPYQGHSGTGQPVYGEPATVPGRFEAKRRLVRQINAGGDIGEDAISEGGITIRPGLDIPTKSRVTVDGTPYVVLQVLTGQGLTRPSHVELLVG